MAQIWEDAMGNRDAIERHNAKLDQAGLIDELVENTDWEPVGRFVAAVGTTGKAIIDVGCSTGKIASLIAESTGPWKSYQGVDLYQGYVDKFNLRGLDEAKAAVGDATDLHDYATSSVDVALCLFVLQHLSKADGRRALREIRRVCRPGAGVLLGLTVNRARAEDEKLYAHEKAIKAGAEPVLTAIWTKGELLQALAEEGFEIGGDPEEIPGREPYAKLFVRMVPRK
jgi:ubiquinone/menaquinone biosynthesis C-methylase UbiE